MTYNMKRPPMDNVLVRQALAHAVDYNAIRQVVVQGQAVTANTARSPTPQGVATRRSRSTPSTPNVEAAARPGRRQQPDAVDDLLAAGPGHRPVGHPRQGDAAQAGITIDLQGIDRNTYLAKTNAGDYDIYAGYFAIMDDPVTNMALPYLPDGAINYSQVNDPELTARSRRRRARSTRRPRRHSCSRPPARARERERQRHVHAEPLLRAQRLAGFVTKPSELLSIIDPVSLANVTKK